MTLYFGGFPEVVGLPLLLSVLISLVFYLKFHRQPGVRTLIALIAAFAVAGWCDWPAYVLVPVLVAHFVMTRPRQDWQWIAAFGLFACALFAAVYIYIALATGAPWDWMAPLLSRRGTVGTNSLGLGAWLGKAWNTNRLYHTVPLLLASGIWVIGYGLRRGQSPGATVGRLLIAWGALHVVIGAQAVSTHAWWWSPLTPGIAVTTGLLIDRFLVAAERRGFGPAAGWTVGVVMLLFAIGTGYTTYRRLYPDERAQPFTPIQLGEAIRAAAPHPSEVALLVGGEEAEAQLWFYGDRPLRVRIWSVEEFERRLGDERVELMYDFDVQRWPAVGVGLVFPTVYRTQFAGLRTYLRQRYRLIAPPPGTGEHFEIFDLRTRLGALP
jgi:hypothetical protein